MASTPTSALTTSETPSAARVDSRLLAVVAAVSLLSLAIRLYNLGVPNITPDEWFSLRIAREGPIWLLELSRYFEPHPPLYYFGFMLTVGAAGESEFAMRFLSVACGVLTVPAGYALGRALLGSSAGVALALLLAVNPYQVAQAQNARGYTLMTLLIVVSTYLLVVALRRGRRHHWVAYGLVCTAMLYTHYSAGLVWLSHAALILALALPSKLPRRGVLLPWVKSQLITLVLFGPWVIYALPLLTTYRGFYPDPVTPIEMLRRTLVTYAAGQQVDAAGKALALAVLALACLGCVFAWRRNSMAAVVGGLGVAVPLAIAAAAFTVRPMFEERYLVVLAPAYLLLAAFGTAAVWRLNRVLGAATLVAVVCASLYNVGLYYPQAAGSRSDYRALAGWVSAVGQPDEVIVASGHGVAELFSYYYRGPLPLYIAGNDDARKVLEEVMARRPDGIWFLPYCDTETDVIATDILSRVGYAADGRWFNNAQFKYYALESEPATYQPADAVWGGKLRLEEWSSAPAAVEPGGVLRVALRWRALGRIEHDYKVSLRLSGPDGQRVSQLDRRPVNELEPMTNWLPDSQIEDHIGLRVPFATIPGEYHLDLVVYDAASGKVEPVTVAASSPQALLGLGSVRVLPATRPTPMAALETDRAPTALAPDLALVSHHILAKDVKAGDPVSVALLWHAPMRPAQQYTYRLELVDEQGSVVGAVDAPVGGDHRTSDWIAGEAIWELSRLAVMPSAEAGPYHLILRVAGADGRAWPGPGGQDAPRGRGGLPLGTVNVEAPQRAFTAPVVSQPLRARFGSFAQLVGYDLSSRNLSPGEVATLTLFWQALSTPDRSYTVFTHLLDSQERVRGQRDQMPVGGERPTTSWVAGEYLVDRYELQVAPDAEPGEYVLELGLYDAQTGERLTAHDDAGSVIGNRVVIPGIVIEAK